MSDGNRATIFGGNADHYDKYRPSYPAEVIDIVVETNPTRVIDAGCGTGKAATLVTARGVNLSGVEPDQRMADVARRHGITVTVSTLEDWSPESCDVMYSAQAWHWIDPRRGAEVAAISINKGGQWLAFWNYETDSFFIESREAVYERLAPELYGVSVSVIDEALRVPISAAFADTEQFDDVAVRQVEWTDHVSVGAAVQRLATNSAHQLLDPDLNEEINTALAEELARRSKTVDVAYTTRVFSARRR